eukprot:RCo004916
MSSDPTLKALIHKASLNWIFVGGKGGVGKTTISCSLAVQLAKTPVEVGGVLKRRRVLIISTDPAHNLSDAFAQKFAKEPTKVEGLDNLDAMEIDPTLITQSSMYSEFGEDRLGPTLFSLANVVQEAASTLPGIDEVTTFVEIMKRVQKMDYDVVVFDTAPTGHTLRLLSFPHLLNSTIDKVVGNQGLSGLLQQAASAVSGVTGISADSVKEKAQAARESVRSIQEQFQDNNRTTFVCVCIPEFLSVYETERLIQELSKYGIGVDHVCVNQLVLRPDCAPPCKMCQARTKIQGKYLEQVEELYEGFHIVKLPLLGSEVRGPKALESFGEWLVRPFDVDKEWDRL